MKKLFSFLTCIAIVPISIAQHFLPLGKSGKQQIQDINTLNINGFWHQQKMIDNKHFVILQFNGPVTKAIKDQMQRQGILLHGFIPPNAYSASLTNELDKNSLQQLNVQSIAFLSPQNKISPQLLLFKYNNLQKSGKQNILVKINEGINISLAKQIMADSGFTIVPNFMENDAVLQCQTNVENISKLAAIPFVEWLEPAHLKDKNLDNYSREYSYNSIAAAPTNLGGYGLSGAGVTIGIGDDGNPSDHIDLMDRVTDRSGFQYNEHDTHVAGTMAGAGINRFLSRGAAPSAKIVSQLFSRIWQNAGTYINDFGMVATNNSYGVDYDDPNYFGGYDLYSRSLDLQAFQYPELLNVFAAGNSGNQQVGNYPFAYGTVLSGYQSAKNVISVGQENGDYTPSKFNSTGPLSDGRLKPDMMGYAGSISPINGGGYAQDYGSSIAAPAVTGAAALLVEQYRKTHAGANPKSDLIKNILMNGAMDIGNTGIDFSTGHGLLNVERSLDILHNNHYYLDSIGTGSVQNQTIAVPAGIGQLKVLVYWHDPAAAAFASHALVNDLDLEVIDPSNNIVYPQILDTLPANVANASTTGVDHFNNNEQVVINNPVAGNYTIRIKGTAINVNPLQAYVVSYDLLTQGLHIGVPFANDTYSPGDLIGVYWYDYGTPNNLRTLEYSVDSGATWNNITSSIAGTDPAYGWSIPTTITPTSKARLRISENGTSFTYTTPAFSIMDPVNFSFAPTAEQCEGYCKIKWPAVNGADDYEIQMKQGPDMVSIGITTADSFIVSGLNKDSVYWFAMRPRKGGLFGKRTDGQAYQPNVGGCTLGISSGDLKLDSIASPITGRQFTSTALTPNTIVTVRVKNLDVIPISNFDVLYNINGGTFMSQHISTTIAGGSTATYSFPAVDLSLPSTYIITAIVKNNATDPISANDTLRSTIKQLANSPIDLSTPHIENFDAAPAKAYNANIVGLDSLDRWDFSTNTTAGRIRTFVDAGIARSGNNALTIDVNQYIAGGSTNYALGTFNLSNYSNTDELRMDLYFKTHGSFQLPGGDNYIWFRPNENAPWVKLGQYQAYDNQPMQDGVWYPIKSLNLTKTYINTPYQISSSAQIRFGQNSILGMGDNEHYGGISLDDIQLYKVTRDFAVSLQSPTAPNNCSTVSATPVTVYVSSTIANSGGTNIPVNLQVDGGTIYTEYVPCVGGYNNLCGNELYTFTHTADLTANGQHNIKVWVSDTADEYRGNDTTSVQITTVPTIASFPYFQDFETDNGNFYTGGKNSSWQYGLPQSFNIKTAASGTHAWKTNLTGDYNDEEQSYLYSPCFNVAALTNPTLSFAMAYKIEYCRPDVCDTASLEYSTDGINWIKLGAAGQGTNWYNNANNNTWDSAKTNWHVATIALPKYDNLRLRFVLTSDIGTDYEGIAIDDIHIYDKAFDIFDNAGNSSNIITQNVSGNNQIDFIDNNQLITSILPNNNTLGSTATKAWINNAAVRNDGKQYYADRNITIQPATTTTAAPVTVRFYFLDKEVEALRNATGCTACTPPADYTKLGITKYDDADNSKENGTLADDNTGSFSFLPSTTVKKVPYAQGYYAEFSVNNFSEFWLNDGTTQNLALPAQWLSFSANKLVNNDVQLNWATANEQNVLQYDVEMALGGPSVLFVKIGSVTANNLAINNYSFIDNANNKSGIRYYRIKLIDKDGHFSYSETRAIVFGDKSDLLVFPNPVKTKLQLAFSATANSVVKIMLYDVTGKLLLQQQVTGTGFMQQESLNVSMFANGVYQLKALINGKENIVKVIKD